MSVRKAPPPNVLPRVIPIVEGKLYMWGRWVKEQVRPASPVSNVYALLREYQGGQTPQMTERRGSSQQERWVNVQDEALQIDHAVRDVMRKMPEIDRLIVWLKYVEKMTWNDMEKYVHYSHEVIRKLFRERILNMFASEFGLFEGGQPKDG